VVAAIDTFNNSDSDERKTVEELSQLPLLNAQ